MCFIDLGLIFLEKRVKIGRCLFEYVGPGIGYALENVEWVRKDVIVLFDDLETCCMLVFQVGVTSVVVGLKVVFPFVDSGVFVECSLMLLGRKKGVDDGLALGGSGGQR